MDLFFHHECMLEKGKTNYSDSSYYLKIPSLWLLEMSSCQIPAVNLNFGRKEKAY